MDRADSQNHPRDRFVANEGRWQNRSKRLSQIQARAEEKETAPIKERRIESRFYCQAARIDLARHPYSPGLDAYPT